jgi:undecaprenyl phosphate-alpha-L-ara4N flippase subunit ArnF
MDLDPTKGPATPESLRCMDLTTVLLLLISVALATAGQLLLKAGMNELGSGRLGIGDVAQLLGHSATTWQVILGLVAFGTSAMFWLLTLSRVPLSTAYPAVSLSYVLILVFSVVVLDERPTTTVWTGAAFVMTGISLIGIGQR